MWIYACILIYLFIGFFYTSSKQGVYYSEGRLARLCPGCVSETNAGLLRKDKFWNGHFKPFSYSKLQRQKLAGPLALLNLQECPSAMQVAHRVSTDASRGKLTGFRLWLRRRPLQRNCGGSRCYAETETPARPHYSSGTVHFFPLSSIF